MLHGGRLRLDPQADGCRCVVICRQFLYIRRMEQCRTRESVAIIGAGPQASPPPRTPWNEASAHRA